MRELSDRALAHLRHVTAWPDFSAAAIEENLGDVPNDIYVASGYRLAGSGYKQYQKDMKAVGQQGTIQDNTQAVATWLGVQLIADIIDKIYRR